MSNMQKVQITGGKRVFNVPVNEKGLFLSRRGSSTPYYGVRRTKNNSSGFAIQFTGSKNPSDWFHVGGHEDMTLEDMAAISTTITASELRHHYSNYELQRSNLLFRLTNGNVYALKQGYLRPYTSEYFDMDKDATDWLALDQESEIATADIVSRHRPLMV